MHVYQSSELETDPSTQANLMQVHVIHTGVTQILGPGIILLKSPFIYMRRFTTTHTAKHMQAAGSSRNQTIYLCTACLLAVWYSRFNHTHTQYTHSPTNSLERGPLPGNARSMCINITYSTRPSSCLPLITYSLEFTCATLGIIPLCPRVHGLTAHKRLHRVAGSVG